MISNLLGKWKSAVGGGNVTSRHSISLNIKLAALVFSSKRADYYQFLADLMEGTKGTKSLMDIFRSDVDRYGESSRGVLSAHWARRFDHGGGDLAYTFDSTLPDEDVTVLSTLQREGGEKALESGLRDLATNNALLKKAKGIIVATMISSIFALLALAGFIVLMPAFIVPKTLASFSMLPPENYPPSAASLVAFSRFVENNWVFIMATVVGMIVLCIVSMSRLRGPVRRFFDKYLIIWGMHRDFQCIRFLSFLATMMRKDNPGSVLFKDAIDMQSLGASKWKRYHLDLMSDMLIKKGKVGPELFATGIMDKTMEWHMADLIEARGLEDALQHLRVRLEARVLTRITIQSRVLSSLIMAVSIFLSAYLMIWQSLAFDDLRKALIMFVSN